MTSMDHETVVLALDAMIRDTQLLIDKAARHGLDKTQSEDYDRLQTILDSAVKQQRKHTVGMLRGFPNT